jgi:putative oxygen-independent coproporphyrinogen III oxidase
MKNGWLLLLFVLLQSHHLDCSAARTNALKQTLAMNRLVVLRHPSLSFSLHHLISRHCKLNLVSSFGVSPNRSNSLNVAFNAPHAAKFATNAMAMGGGIPSPTISSTSRIIVPEEESAVASSVYVHIPFCRKRCFYCDFPIVAVGERTTEAKSAHIDAGMTDYVDLVCREIRMSAKVNSTQPLKTVFFGGGTPSLLPPSLLLRILETLRTQLGFDSSGVEISMEMDPGTFDVHTLRQLMDGGLNRVSMGVQSFNHELLKSCGRAHGLAEVYEAVEAIRSSGLRNWSLDLISSLPNQTLEHWEHSIKEAVLASPAHISVYDLQIEEGTLFNKWYKAGEFPLPSDDKAAEFYRIASKKLREAGFAHYEISNYAKEGYECMHNLVYWKNLPYFAFGLGSTSYIGGQRFSRPRTFKEYRKFVERFEGMQGSLDCPKDSREERALDTVMLSLRLARGLQIREFIEKFGRDVCDVMCKALIPFASSGHVVFMDVDKQIVNVEALQRLFEVRNGNDDSEEFDDHTRLAYVRLTDPEGFLLSNEVIASIFSALPSGG